VLSLALAALAVLGSLAAWWFVGRRREGAAFASTALTLGASVAGIFAGLYPNVMVSSTDRSYDLTIAGAASGTYALTVMSWVALVLFPVVLLYQGWTFRVFRARLRRTDVVAAD
jgi:cytochrome d ubiquinol oxidase subunit II